MCATAQAVTTIFTTVNVRNEARRHRFDGRYLEGGSRIVLRQQFAVGQYFSGGRGAAHIQGHFTRVRLERHSPKLGGN
jgi:hypothetical protein